MKIGTYSKLAFSYYSSQYDDFGSQDTQVPHFAQEEMASIITISDKYKNDKSLVIGIPSEL